MAENRELALVLKLVADQFQSELKKSQGALSGFNSFVKDWKTQLGAVSGVLVAGAKSTANFGEEALKASQRLGTTVEQTTALQYAAHLADVPMATLEKGLKGLAQTAVEAANGTGEGARLFHALGISATDAHGKIKPLDQLFFEVQDRLKGVGNQAQFVDAGVKVFGKSFLEMVPLIKQGSDATKDAMEEGRKFGVVMTQEQAVAANRFNDELKKLNAQLNGLKLSLGNELLPVMSQLIETFRTLGVGTGISAGLGFLHDQFVRLNVLLKELQANSQFLFGTGKSSMNLDELKARIAEIEADAKKKLFEFHHSGVLTTDAPPKAGASGGGGTDLPLIADQEKLGKALLEIHLAMNRAIDIENKLRTEGADIFRLQTDRQLQREKEDADFQERQGKAIVEQTQLEVRIREEARSKELQGLTDNLKAWQTYGEQISGSTEFILNKRLDLVRAELAKELDTTTDTAGKLLIAWQNSDEDALQSLRLRLGKTDQELETSLVQAQTKYKTAINELSGDFVEGWAAGMRRYVRDTQSGFGMAADMARRAVQSMEQASGRFFFDAMEGRITRLKDVMTAFLDFTKQIVSQLAAQAFTKQIAGAIAGSGFFGGGGGANTNFTGDIMQPLRANSGGMIQRFASGGPVFGNGNLDTVPALLTPGEFVLSRRDVHDIKSGLGGGVSVVVNNYGQNDVQASSGQGPDGRQMIYVTVRDIVRGMVRGGELDGPMGQRFGVNPAPGRR